MTYPTIGATDERRNYIEPAVGGTVGYVNNILPSLNAPPQGASSYAVAPSLSVNRTTTRQHVHVQYNPIFTFYEPSSVSVLDAVDQSALVEYQNHPSPYLAINVDDYFARTSNVFNGSYPFSQGGLTGGLQNPGAAAIAPFAQQLSDTADAGLAYQFGRNAMVGASGSYANFKLLDPGEANGLDNSHGGGGSAFYDRRIAAMQYLGLSYEYDRTLAGPSTTEVDAKLQTILPFYTLYLTSRLSCSLSGGMQYVVVEQPTKPTANSWQPAGAVSMGWQGNRGAVSANYLHTITTGKGVAGAYNSDSVNGIGTWNFNRKWVARVEVSYTTLNAFTQLANFPAQSGNSYAIWSSLHHDFNDNLTLEGGYERLHQNFAGIPVITENPDSDREFVTVTYRFQKQLGR
jgi:hypothetical protein